ncbi:MAG: hypothetical protein WCW27_04685 [Patescibacteria group bacterium]|jgi:hypothetical protein
MLLKQIKYSLLFSAILLAGCAINNNTVNTNNNNTNVSVTDLDLAEQTFIKFYDLLSKQQYAEAVTMFDPDLDNSVGWEQLEQYVPEEQRSDQAKILAGYCTTVIDTCVPTTVLSKKQIGTNKFHFTVQFKDVAVTTCCDDKGKMLPTQTEFTAIVEKTATGFKVVTPPVYHP